jgi:hypothetical protein
VSKGWIGQPFRTPEVPFKTEHPEAGSSTGGEFMGLTTVVHAIVNSSKRQLALGNKRRELVAAGDIPCFHEVAESCLARIRQLKAQIASALEGMRNLHDFV